jgi:hypothetical protein
MTKTAQIAVGRGIAESVAGTAIASSDLHNLVYRADYRLVPAVTINSSRMTSKLGEMRPLDENALRTLGVGNQPDFGYAFSSKT